MSVSSTQSIKSIELFLERYEENTAWVNFDPGQVKIDPPMKKLT